MICTDEEAVNQTLRFLVGTVLVPGLLGELSTARADKQEASPDYRSPYSVKFTYSRKELLDDIDNGPRGDPKLQAEIPFSQWYSPRVRMNAGSWGPHPRHYPAPAGIERRSPEWKRERVIAVALRFQGYAYQHHHIPDWDPPADWPWKHVGHGRNSKGVDCSNFSSFVYNLALGIKPNSAIGRQAEQLDVPGPGHNIRGVHIQKPEAYADLAKTFKSGDLLFIRSNKEEISHVVIWVGPIGESPDGTPLIIDSHGANVTDSNDATIPDGVHLRPFREKSWYYNSASHALRLIQGE